MLEEDKGKTQSSFAPIFAEAMMGKKATEDNPS